jgi:hypothetical protein
LEQALPEIESDQEMLQFRDDPSLFEFNQCNEYADLDNYEPIPVPSNHWQPTAAQKDDLATQ